MGIKNTKRILRFFTEEDDRAKEKNIRGNKYPSAYTRLDDDTVDKITIKEASNLWKTDKANDKNDRPYRLREIDITELTNTYKLTICFHKESKLEAHPTWVHSWFKLIECDKFHCGGGGIGNDGVSELHIATEELMRSVCNYIRDFIPNYQIEGLSDGEDLDLGAAFPYEFMRGINQVLHAGTKIDNPSWVEGEPKYIIPDLQPVDINGNRLAAIEIDVSHSTDMAKYKVYEKLGQDVISVKIRDKYTIEDINYLKSILRDVRMHEDALPETVERVTRKVERILNKIFKMLTFVIHVHDPDKLTKYNQIEIEQAEFKAAKKAEREKMKKVIDNERLINDIQRDLINAATDKEKSEAAERIASRIVDKKVTPVNNTIVNKPAAKTYRACNIVAYDIPIISQAAKKFIIDGYTENEYIKAANKKSRNELLSEYDKNVLQSVTSFVSYFCKVKPAHNT